MENIINKQIGIFDFWGVFCVGAVILTSFIILIGHSFIRLFFIDLSIFIYIIIAYVTGLILHSLSSALIDCSWLIFNTTKVLTADYEKRILFKMYYNKFLLHNNQIFDDTKKKGFQKCYNFLKHTGVSCRTDKLHSLYVMSRGIFLGYLILSGFSAFNLFCHLIPIGVGLNIFYLILYLILTVNFYAMAKKYFFRWIEWALLEYQYIKCMEANI